MRHLIFGVGGGGVGNYRLFIFFHAIDKLYIFAIIEVRSLIEMFDKDIRMRISLEIARDISSWLIDNVASRDKDAPIAVTIVDPSGVTIIQEAMDGVKPISPELSRKKAWTSIAVKCDTIELEGLNPMNFADDNITCFPGGILIQAVGSRNQTEIVGAIGVSGRKGKQPEGMKTLQDHELALLAARELATMVHDDWVKRYNMHKGE